MGARTIWSEFKNQVGKTYRISLMTTGVSAHFEEVTADGNGFTLSYEGDDNNRFEEFKESSTTWGFYVENTGVETFLFDLEDAEDDEYYLMVEEETSTNVYERRWQGPVEMGNSSWEDAGFPYRYEIVATDGIGHLDDILYNDPLNNTTLNDPASRIAPTIEYIIDALTQINASEVYASDDILSVYLNLYEENILPGTINNSNLIQTDTLGQVYVDHLAFVSIKLEDTSAIEAVKSPDKNQLEAISQLEVLRNLMRVFGCRLYLDFETGLWTMEEIAAWHSRATGQNNLYDTSYAITGSDSTPAVIDFDNVNALAGGNTFYSEKYNSWSVNYKHNIGGIHMPDYAQFNGTSYLNMGPSRTAALNFYDTEHIIGGVATGEGNNQFDLQAHIRTAVAANSGYVGDTAWLTVKCWIDDTIGTTDYYLENSQGQLKWSTDSTARVNTSKKFPAPPAPVAPSVIDWTMKLICPPIPTTGILKLKININNFKNKVLGVSMLSTKVLTYYEGEQFDYTEYRSQKATASNREINYVAGEVIIGDGPFWFSPSALLWKDGTDYVQTSNWIDRKQANASNFVYYPLLNIMSQFALEAFSNNRRVMQLSFRGDFGPSRLITRGTRVYRPTATSYNATSHIWETTSNHIGITAATGIDLGDDTSASGFVGKGTFSPTDEKPTDLSNGATGVVSLDGGSIGVSFNDDSDARGGTFGYQPFGNDPESLIDEDYGNDPT